MCNKFSIIILNLVIVIVSVKAFNLEYRIPVLKYGEEGSFFGFSVAEHQTINDGEKKSWMLVGAPQGQNLQPNTSRSGALFRCPLTTRYDDCTQIITDGRVAIDSDDLRPPSKKEQKDDQWLGVTVRSQGNKGKAVVCAHRYILVNGESQTGQGLCYTLSNSLEFEEEHQPCSGLPSAKEHEEFGYCQAGTSSSFLEDGSLILGSPGSYAWRGNLFVMDRRDEYLERDHTIFYTPVLANTAPVDKYSYLGMSSAGGNFFGNKTSYVAGAPRAEGTGQVLIFNKVLMNRIMKVEVKITGEQFASQFGYELTTADVNGDGKVDLIVGAPFYFDRNSGGSVYIYLNDNYSIKSNFSIKLTGKIESRFGFAISNAGDLNKDGCDDIAIGSPYEGNGVVYIYLGSKSNGIDREPKQIIRSEMLPLVVPMKTFGYSISGGTDLDNNGYPDLLIGAYEQDTVVLLRARPIIAIETNVKLDQLSKIDPTKRGCPSDKHSNRTCFSFDICCEIKALKTFTSDESLKLNYVIEAETFEEDKKYSRVFFRSVDDSMSNIIEKNITLNKNRYHKCEPHTVYLKENTRDIQSSIKFHVNYTLVLKEPDWPQRGELLSMDTLPILNVSQAVLKFEAHLLRDCGEDDICDSEMDTKVALQLPLSDDKRDQYTLALGIDKEIKLDIAIENLRESAYDPQVYVSHHGDISYIGVVSQDKYVICNKFNETMVICSLENPFKKNKPLSITLRFDPKSLGDHEMSFEFSIMSNTTSVDKRRDTTPKKIEVRVEKNAEISIKGSARPEQVFYGGAVKGESAMKDLDDIGSRVVHTFEVFNLGPWRINSVDVVIDWPHQIANNKEQGKWLLYLDRLPTVEGEAGDCFMQSAAAVNPLNLTSKHETTESTESNRITASSYSSQRRSKDTKEFVRTKREIELAEPEFHSKCNPDDMNCIERMKRDTEMIVKSEAYIDNNGTRREIVNMDCDTGTAKCIRIVCRIYKLGQNQEATIKVHGHLWNSSLVEDYSGVQYVSVASRAKLIFPKHHNIHQKNTDDDKATVQTRAYPNLAIQGKKDIMWWVILSAIIGILLLIALILILWKCGFFKRRRMDMTLSGNIEKQPESSPFLKPHG